MRFAAGRKSRRHWMRLQAGSAAEDMRAMNEAVDGQRRDPAEVVRAFRVNKGL